MKNDFVAGITKRASEAYPRGKHAATAFDSQLIFNPRQISEPGTWIDGCSSDHRSYANSSTISHLSHWLVGCPFIIGSETK